MFIGVSAPNLLTGDDIATMAEGSIVFAMANPVPEVDPLAAAEHASVVATGRSDFPNQINNVLAFPGVFRGLLDAQSHSITVEMLLAAARALAAVVTDDQLNASYIVPSVFHPDVSSTVAAAVSQAVRATGSSVLGDDELALARGRGGARGAVTARGLGPRAARGHGRGAAGRPVLAARRRRAACRTSTRLVHAAVFGAVAWAGCRAGVPHRVLVPLLVAQAVVSEVVQARLLAGRSGDPADVVADLVGTGLGLLIAHRPGTRRGQRASWRA